MVRVRSLDASSSDSAEALMRRVLRAGGELAREYPLVFDGRFDGRVVVAFEDGGTPLSACTTLVRELVVGGERVRAGLIGSVATDPAHRGRGLASAVLRAAEEGFESAGCLFTLLWADDPAFYHGRGYCPVGTELDFVVDPDTARRLPPAHGVRAATAADAPTIHALYSAHLERCERRVAETRALLQGPGVHTFVRERAGRVVAYACAGRGADLQGVVHEWAGASEDVAALVRAHADARAADPEAGPLVVMAPASASALARHLATAGAPSARGVLGMGRLVGWNAATELVERLAMGAARVAPSADAPGLRIEGPGGDAALDAEATLLALLGVRGTRDITAELEDRTGLRLGRLPLAPFVWGLDSI